MESKKMWIILGDPSQTLQYFVKYWTREQNEDNKFIIDDSASEKTFKKDWEAHKFFEETIIKGNMLGYVGRRIILEEIYSSVRSY